MFQIVESNLKNQILDQISIECQCENCWIEFELLNRIPMTTFLSTSSWETRENKTISPRADTKYKMYTRWRTVVNLVDSNPGIKRLYIKRRSCFQIHWNIMNSFVEIPPTWRHVQSAYNSETWRRSIVNGSPGKCLWRKFRFFGGGGGGGGVNEWNDSCI